MKSILALVAIVSPWSQARRAVQPACPSMTFASCSSPPSIRPQGGRKGVLTSQMASLITDRFQGSWADPHRRDHRAPLPPAGMQPSEADLLAGRRQPAGCIRPRAQRPSTSA